MKRKIVGVTKNGVVQRTIEQPSPDQEDAPKAPDQPLPADMPQLVGSLEEVRAAMNGKYSWVIKWRDKDNCPFLVEPPYNVTAIRQWLVKQAEFASDPMSELGRRKAKAEAEDLEKQAFFLLATSHFGLLSWRWTLVGEKVIAWLDRKMNEEKAEDKKPSNKIELQGVDVSEHKGLFKDEEAFKQFKELLDEATKDGSTVTRAAPDKGNHLVTFVPTEKPKIKFKRLSIND